MQKIKDFFKSFIDIESLYRFKDITIFISLLILVMETYLLFLPVKFNYNHNIYKYANENEYTYVLYNASTIDNKIINEIKDNAYSIKEDKMVSKTSNDGIHVYEIKYTKDDKVNNLYLVFDINDIKDKELNEVFKAYHELYKDDSDEKSAYAGNLAYIDSLKGRDLEEGMEEYHGLEVDVLKEKLSKYETKDMYGIKEKDAYLIIFNDSDFDVNIYKTDEDTISFSKDYSNIDLNNDYNTIGDFTKIFANDICKVLIEGQELMPYLFMLILCVFIYPIVLAFLMFLALRKREVLIRYTEYLNTMCILSLPVFLISFVLSFIPALSGDLVYMILFGVYTAFMMFRMGAKEVK